MREKLMKLIHTKKTPLFWSILCMMLCCSLLVGTTFAWFTDSVSSGTSHIQPGTLEVGLAYRTVRTENNTTTISAWADAESKTDILPTSFEPGDVSLTLFKVENLGNLSLQYQLALMKSSESKGVNVLGEEYFLSDYLSFDWVVLSEETAIKKSEALSSTETSDFTNEKVLKLIGNSPIYGFGVQHTVEDVMTVTDKNAVVALVITMPSNVGMAAMYDATKDKPSLSLDFKLAATQYEGERDSFGTDYDSAAAKQINWRAMTTVSNQIASGMKIYQEGTGAPAGTEILSVTGTKPVTGYLVASISNSPVNFAVESGVTYQSYNLSVLDENGNVIEDTYTVRIYVGKNLSDCKLYHNGNPVGNNDPDVTDMNYNSTTGYLTFKTTKFSIYTFASKGAVASVDGKTYSTFEEALNAGLKSGKPVVMQAKVTGWNQQIVVTDDKSLTIDLNGCQLVSSLRKDANKLLLNKGTFTLTDSSEARNGLWKITVPVEADLNGIMESSGRMTLENGTIDVTVNADKDGNVSVVQSFGDLTINQAAIKAVIESETKRAGNYIAVRMTGENKTLSMKDSSVTLESRFGTLYGVYAEKTSRVSAESCTVKVNHNLANAGAAYGMVMADSVTGSVKEITLNVRTADTDSQTTEYADAYGLVLSTKKHFTVDGLKAAVNAGTSSQKMYGVQYFGGSAELKNMEIVMTGKAAQMTGAGLQLNPLDGSDSSTVMIDKCSVTCDVSGVTGLENSLTNLKLKGNVSLNSKGIGIRNNGTIEQDNLTLEIQTVNDSCLVNSGTIGALRGIFKMKGNETKENAAVIDNSGTLTLNNVTVEYLGSKSGMGLCNRGTMNVSGYAIDVHGKGDCCGISNEASGNLTLGTGNRIFVKSDDQNVALLLRNENSTFTNNSGIEEDLLVKSDARESSWTKNS